MATNVIMPQMGESVAEGTIVRWLKAVGDSVDRDEPIFEITTDKVDAEIPLARGRGLARDQGPRGRDGRRGRHCRGDWRRRRERRQRAGPSGRRAAPAAQEAPKAAAPAPAAAPVSDKPRRRDERGRAAPDAQHPGGAAHRGRARGEHRADLGHRPRRRVTKKDIEAFIASGAHSRRQRPRRRRRLLRRVGSSLGIPMRPVKVRDRDSVEKMSPMRRTISDRMIESKHYSAHVHSCFEIDYTASTSCAASTSRNTPRAGPSSRSPPSWPRPPWMRCAPSRSSTRPTTARAS